MKQHPRNRTLVRYLIAWLAAVLVALPAFTEPERFKAADSQGVTATRDSTALYLAVDTDVKGSIKIPRLAAPLRSMVWQGSTAGDGVSLKPEQDHWVIRWKSRPAQDATLVLQFDDEPLLLSEIEAIKKTGDGSFYLPAHLAATRGKNIRYEPQTAKNTVGYWTGKQDAATWRIKLNKPGRFNVAILQGCGKGQGGSDATMSFVRPVDTNTQDASLDFKVVETGHFQNFQWRTLGEVSLNTAGEIDLIVMPKQIKKGALMDIRAIHLIRLPDKKK